MTNLRWIKISITSFLIMFLIPCLYAESELEKALSEGWDIETPQKSKEQAPVFSLITFDIVNNNIIEYFNPENVIYNKPSQINITQTRYESDGIEIKSIDNEEWDYSDNIVAHSFESDSLLNDVTETYDEFGRRVGEVRMLRETGRIYQNRTFSYDEENQMMFWYENNRLTYVVTEYKDQNKSVYTKYTKNTKSAMTNKREAITIFHNTDRTISKIENTLYLGRGSTSTITCEYSNGKITRLVYYSQSIDSIIMDIQYTYEGNRFVASNNKNSNNTIRHQYSDFDRYENWTTNTYYRDGVLQGVIKREIIY